MRNLTVAFMLAMFSPAVVAAQNCPPAPPSTMAAPVPGAPWFESQVDTPALFIADGAVTPHPDPSLNQQRPFPSDFALAQFIVDTVGVPAAKSLVMLKLPEGLVADSVKSALSHWRYTPAKAKGCAVPQMVQVALRWK